MDKQTFFGGLNFDDEDRIVPAQDYRLLINAHNGTSESENTGTVTNVNGNTLITFTLPGGQNTCIGAFEDKKDNTVIYFVHNANGDHQILRFFPVTKTIISIVKSSLLGFSTSYLITGIALIDSTLLFWTDDNQEPGFLDINAFIGGEYPTTLTEQHIRAIPYAPTFPPTVIYANDGSKKINNLKNSLFQFKYQYVYRDDRPSAWSPISKLAIPTTERIYGSALPSYIDNRIDITLNTGDGLVTKIKVAARIGNIGDFFLIDTLDKAELSLSNDVDTDLQFFNDGLYPSVELTESNKLFDFLPKKAKALAPIDGNRIAYGNGVDGFDQVELDITLNPVYRPLSDLPSAVSHTVLSVLSWAGTSFVVNSINTPVEGDVYSIAFQLQMQTTLPVLTYTSKLYKYLEPAIAGDTILTIFARFKTQMDNDTSLTSAYLSNSAGGGGTATNSVNIYAANTGTIAVSSQIVSFDPTDALPVTTQPTILSVDVSTESSNPMKIAFKSGATHEIGLIYYDFANRSSTVMISPQSKVYVEHQSERAVKDGWADMRMFIGHTPPIGATHYQLAYTKNQGISTFAVTPENITVSGTTTTMVLTYLEQFATDNPGALFTYDWAVGDRIRFIQNRNSGSFFSAYVDIEISAYDSGTNTITFESNSNLTTGEGYLVELYTPQKTIDSKLYYEIGECFEIGDAGLSTRYHKGSEQDQDTSIGQEAEILTDNQGDIYFRSRTYGTGADLYIEDPSYSDFFTSNYCNIGRPNVYDSGAKELRRLTTIWYSQQFIPDTNINGLGSFFDTNFEEYNKNYDSIQYLLQQNSDLLIFQELKVGAIPINQSIFSDTQGQSVVSASLDILSKVVRYYAGEYGIGVHPESLAVYGNRKYFTDVPRGAVLRLSTDGLTPISEYKARSFFAQRFRDIGNRLAKTNIYGVYDVKYGRYILSLEKKTSDVTVVQGLVDITLPIPTFERETIAFDEATNRWKMFFSYQPEMMCGSNLDIVTFKNGALYLHDDNSTKGEFYGVQYPMELTFVHNVAPANMKVYNGMQTDSNEPFDVEMTNQFGQTTHLITTDFEEIEKVFWAAFWKDENTPVPNPLFEGDDMRCHTATIKLTNNLTTFVKLFAVGIKTQMSELTNR